MRWGQQPTPHQSPHSFQHCVTLVHLAQMHRASVCGMATMLTGVRTMFCHIGRVQCVCWTNVTQTFVQCPFALDKCWVHMWDLHHQKHFSKNLNLTKLDLNSHGTGLNFWLNQIVFMGPGKHATTATANIWTNNNSAIAQAFGIRPSSCPWAQANIFQLGPQTKHPGLWSAQQSFRHFFCQKQKLKMEQCVFQFHS